MSQPAFDRAAMGKRLNKALTLHHVGVNEAGRLAGLSSGGVSKLASGQTQKVRLETVVKLTEGLGIHLEWLVLGRGEMDL